MISKITTAPNGQELVNKLNETIEQVNKGGGGGTGGGVTSVNGQTGDVTITVPTDNSQLANGAGYITNTALNPFVKSVTESGNIITVTKGDGSSNTINLPTGGDGGTGSGVEVKQIFIKASDERWQNTGSGFKITIELGADKALAGVFVRAGLLYYPYNDIATQIYEFSTSVDYRKKTPVVVNSKQKVDFYLVVTHFAI